MSKKKKTKKVEIGKLGKWSRNRSFGGGCWYGFRCQHIFAELRPEKCWKDTYYIGRWYSHGDKIHMTLHRSLKEARLFVNTLKMKMEVEE